MVHSMASQGTKTKVDRGLLFIILVSLIICVESYKLGLGTFSLPKSGFFPFVVGISLGGLATVSLLASLFSTGVTKTHKISIPMKRMLPLTLSILAYSFLLDKLGFITSTSILIVFLVKVLENKSWWITVPVGIGVSLFTHFIFKGLFRVQLPPGFMGF